MWKINGQIFPSTNEIKEEKKAKSRKYDKHKREVKNLIKKQKEKINPLVPKNFFSRISR